MTSGISSPTSVPTRPTSPYSSTRKAPPAPGGRLLWATNSRAGMRPPISPTSNSMRRKFATSCRSMKRLSHEPMPIANR